MGQIPGGKDVITVVKSECMHRLDWMQTFLKPCRKIVYFG